ncbi:excitatory amino acid transporter 5-like [Ornithorhynchus anatinus]|uniref:excitatory amino acid transporter 5-like n=1 Tax=Ornithorhynchus anatinus TaxID=9258 RepID=UPI0019D4583A|nr:excitatory amino acid transporter 5-like [Ornithorhynchus anatinus]
MDSLGIILPEPAAGGLGEGGGQAWELVPGAAAGRTCCCCHCSCCCRLGPDSAPPPPHYRPGPQECRRVIGCQGWGLTMGRGVPNWPTGRWGSIRVGVAAFWGQHGLLTLSLLSVIVGCLLGGLLRTLQLSDLEQQYFSFPGELLMRMLKMLILPLITSSLMSGLATMDPQVCGRMGLLTITYYLWTTFMAVTVGIVLVLSIHPGAAAQKEVFVTGKMVLSSADALLDLIRNMFPANLIEAAFQQYRTEVVPVAKGPGLPPLPPGKPLSFLYLAPGPDTDAGRAPPRRVVRLELTPSPEMSYCTRPGTNSEMNVLGIVIFSATLGLLLGRMGERGAPLVNVCQSLNEAVMRIVSVAVWYFPFGIVFLIAGKILEMEDPSTVGRKLGLYMITVVTGLSIHGLLLLPSLFLLITRHNPFPFIRGILQALLIALATSSSSATLPITLKCLLENNGIDRRVARFVLPVGATINMDGTALYEAVAAIFIAQVNELDLDLGQVITVSITATAASIGAAGIPQSGLVTMVIVLTSVGLPTEDITLIVAVDWALDRFRTMTNVLGDALAAGIIAHVCHEDFVPKPEEDPGNQSPPVEDTTPPSSRLCVREPISKVGREHYSLCQV